uniref:BRO-N domain-containing protein n=1 Tax=uncultured Mailhella sp. TaxID=1981031 RepID=UPI0026236CAA
RAFEEHLIRCVQSEGQQWMVFADVCRVLGYKNPQHQAKYLREEEKCKLDIALKNTLVNCVNRNGLRRVCLLSAKEVGRRLSDWADREVFVERR